MQRILALLMVGTLLTLTTSTGLAAGPAVDGSVTQKFTSRADDSSFLIAVDGTPYEVPPLFYRLVQVGFRVHFDGTNWTITSRGAMQLSKGDKV